MGFCPYGLFSVSAFDCNGFPPCEVCLFCPVGFCSVGFSPVDFRPAGIYSLTRKFVCIFSRKKLDGPFSKIFMVFFSIILIAEHIDLYKAKIGDLKNLFDVISY